MSNKKTLRETLEGRDVLYRLGKIGIQTIRQPKKRFMQLDNGTYETVLDDGVYMTRMGDGRSTELTIPMDPDNPVHAKLIKDYDEWISKNPYKATRNQISKLGANRPGERIQNWDNMTVNQVEAVLDAIKPDLIWCMEYELKRPLEIGGPREDIIEVLESAHVEGFKSDVEQSEEAPVL